MKIDFKGASNRWHVGPPDELHVDPKTDAMRTTLRERIGKEVMSVGHSTTRYLVEREEGGVFVLTSAMRDKTEPEGAAKRPSRIGCKEAR